MHKKCTDVQASALYSRPYVGIIQIRLSVGGKTSLSACNTSSRLLNCKINILLFREFVKRYIIFCDQKLRYVIYHNPHKSKIQGQNTSKLYFLLVLRKFLRFQPECSSNPGYFGIKQGKITTKLINEKSRNSRCQAAYNRKFAKNKIFYKKHLTNTFSRCIIYSVIWVWRRLVARYLGVVEVAGSNPVTQTSVFRSTIRVERLFFFCPKKLCVNFCVIHTTFSSLNQNLGLLNSLFFVSDSFCASSPGVGSGSEPGFKSVGFFVSRNLSRSRVASMSPSST